MSILQYFKKDNRPSVCLPDPRSSLSRCLSQAAIRSGNAEVRQCVTTSGQPVVQRSGQPQHYNSYIPSQKATIGKFAVENGVMAVKRKFSAKLKLNINKSTVRRFKTAYLEERRRKREFDDSDGEIKELHPRKRGREVLLGEKMDTMVQCYITKIREKGGVVNTCIVKAGARGILMSQEKSMLAEYGGPATLTTGKIFIEKDEL